MFLIFCIWLCQELSVCICDNMFAQDISLLIIVKWFMLIYNLRSCVGYPAFSPPHVWSCFVLRQRNRQLYAGYQQAAPDIVGVCIKSLLTRSKSTGVQAGGHARYLPPRTLKSRASIHDWGAWALTSSVTYWIDLLWWCHNIRPSLYASQSGNETREDDLGNRLLGHPIRIAVINGQTEQMLLNKKMCDLSCVAGRPVGVSHAGMAWMCLLTFLNNYSLLVSYNNDSIRNVTLSNANIHFKSSKSLDI